MKTHELARILRRLAKLLDDQPDEDIDSFELGRSRRPPPDSANIPFALSTLVSLSEFDKGQWEQLINEFHFPISVRPRDASRDILGKLLKYLEQNPDARRRVVSRANEGRSKTSPELMRALDLLLKT
jgi:hypothetical protein